MGFDFYSRKKQLSSSYELGKHLGSGNFAEVHMCTRKSDGLEFAVKIIDKAKAGTLEAIQDEIQIMERIDHLHVVKLIEVFDETSKINLVMELVTGGELFDRIVSRGSYTEQDASECVREICDALQYMHQNGICHRDLKPENILYASPAEDAQIKLADFGLAKVVDDKTIMMTACGTPGYVAPEILKNTGFGIEVRGARGGRRARSPRNRAPRAPCQSMPGWGCRWRFWGDRARPHWGAPWRHIASPPAPARPGLNRFPLAAAARVPRLVPRGRWTCGRWA
jgi:serine/threonine protein kinase